MKPSRFRILQLNVGISLSCIFLVHCQTNQEPASLTEQETKSASTSTFETLIPSSTASIKKEKIDSLFAYSKGQKGSIPFNNPAEFVINMNANKPEVQILGIALTKHNAFASMSRDREGKITGFILKEGSKTAYRIETKGGNVIFTKVDANEIICLPE